MVVMFSNFHDTSMQLNQSPEFQDYTKNMCSTLWGEEKSP